MRHSLSDPLPRLRISLEIFPPRSAEQAEKLWQVVERLRPLGPEYVSVTCGAGGNYAGGTAEAVETLRTRLGLAARPHLTAMSADRADIEHAARDYWSRGVRRIVALRGDPPTGFEPPADAFPFAAEVVAALRRIGDFEIAVAGYPEAHPESPSADADLVQLKRKVDAGACEVITQYCFDTDRVLRFRDAMASHGIDAKLVVGIMPVHNYAQIARFSARCGASMPVWLGALFEGLDDDPETTRAVAATVGAEQCRRLAAEGLTELHFYTLNKAELTFAVGRLLGLNGVAPERAAA
jgi:methylenetetrahydrofolate reductase (NADPH)